MGQPDRPEPTGPVLEVPEPCTEAFLHFHDEHQRLLSFFVGLTNLALRDHGRSAKQDPDTGAWVTRVPDPRRETSGVDFILKHNGLVLQLLFANGVDNYLAYLRDLLVAVFRAKPEVLKSSETVTYEEILDHASMTELLEFLADRKVHTLSYKSVADLNAHLSKRLGLGIATDAKDVERISTACENRNLLVHNRGIVNERYLSKVPGSRFPLGSKLVLHTREAFVEFIFLHRAAGNLDRAAISKFKLSAARATRAT